MKRILTARSEAELPERAREILAFSGDRRIFVLEGEMGVGKTALIRAFCEVLEVEDPVSSPSFAILHEYRRKNGEKLHHIDLYRVGDEEELFDMGFEEVLEGSSYCFIEWPDAAENFLPVDPVWIGIRLGEDHERRIEIRT